MSAPFSLTKEQAVALCFAFLADSRVRDTLAAGDMDGYAIWSRWRDEKLRFLFGQGLHELHDFGHGLEDAA